MSPLKPALTEPIVYLALGSNLGDRRAHLRRGVELLREQAGAEIVANSALYATEAVGIAGAPEFLNAVIGIRTRLEPEELLRVGLEIERSEGRVRGVQVGGEEASWGQAAPPASRPLDLDLLIWGTVVRSGSELILPHPRLHERAFVLAPLAEIAPAVTVRGRSIADWAAAVGSAGIVRLAGTEDWTRPGAA